MPSNMYKIINNLYHFTLEDKYILFERKDYNHLIKEKKDWINPGGIRSSIPKECIQKIVKD